MRASALAATMPISGPRPADQRQKCRFYVEHGVDVVLLIDPRSRTAELFATAGDVIVLGEHDTFGSPRMPGLAIPLEEVFKSLDA